MPPRRRGRSSRRAAVVRTPTPEEPSDAELPDVDPSTPNSLAQDEDIGNAEAGGILDVDDVNDEDVAASPDNESEASVSRAGSPVPARGRGRGRGRGRRGRPRVRPLGAERSSKERSQEVSDTGTPKTKRGGWRGRGFGAGRWANRKTGGQRQDQMPQDAEGNQLSIENDEAVVPDDAQGETKVDRNGNLLGGREYRVRIFTVLGRERRQYMLSTEPARCIGFRDSYLFFQKHRVLYKIILSDEEKMDLIERDIMPHSYKGRSIGVVTARSVFREFGARIVIGGRSIVDDYFPERARQAGAMEGELAVPEDILPAPGQEYNRNQYVAWHGASAVYHTSGPSMPLQAGDKPKRRVPITSANWMLEHARQASRFNSKLAQDRRMTLQGTYDIHTNIMMKPKSTQPTHVRWERLPSPPPTGLDIRPARASSNAVQSSDTITGLADYSLPAPVPFLARNYMVTDTVYVVPPVSGLGTPGRDGRYADIGTQGLLDVADDVFEALPEDCKADFLAAKAREAEWKEMWQDETTDTRRPGTGGLQGLKTTFQPWDANS